MKKHELKDYNRLLRAENEALKYILQEAEDSLSDGCRCGEIKLLQEENDVLVKDLNDLQADWAADHAEYRKTLEVIKEQNTRECDLNVRLQGNIHELKKEKYDMGMELEKMKKKILRLNGMGEAQL
jgi:hypothetical protein